MNYSRHRLKKLAKDLTNLSGEQRDKIEKKILSNTEPEQTESEPELEQTESETSQPKRRGRRPNAN